MTSKDSLLQILSNHPAYHGLDVNLLAALAEIAYQHSLEPGQFVFLEGSDKPDYYLVEKGWLKASKISTAGREQILQFLGPGSTFNQAALISGNINQFTIEVQEPSTIWVFPREDFHQLMGKYPALVQILAGELADQTTHLVNLIQNLALQTVEARLAGIFLEHSTGDILNRKRWATQAEMAARLGTVPDVLNRALNKLADEGLIKIQRHQIQILDREGLQKKALQGD
ncbi:MAG: Crp/Fnr family transcriptional regulator [Chloroflexi bacterium]|nr:Crp/Fnr family transcriptional regulator [Chloroflexota bacterium]